MSDTRRHLDGDALHVYAGLLILSFGAGLAWVPAGVMVAGLGLILLGAASLWIRSR